jgi:hypothetical protein
MRTNAFTIAVGEQREQEEKSRSRHRPGRADVCLTPFQIKRNCSDLQHFPEKADRVSVGFLG